MANTSSPTIYLQLKKRIQIPRGKMIKLGDIAQILSEPEWEEKLSSLELVLPLQKDGNLLVMDLMQIIPRVKKVIPNVFIESIGLQQVIVEIVGNSKKPSISLFLLVWLLLFFGSALTIMNFHADVNMMEVQIKVVEMVTGKRDEHPYLFQTSYSIGIGFGMVVFFNHLFKKKWNEEPTPLEVEMFLYQENIDEFVVAEEYKKVGTKQDEHPS
ncbi:stage V sporulation protein AA [Paenibacillus antarcticus]|uniref:Stage V sporulation protein AA n=1 Tax=Paenibacillus antarcticus TaxID=253703 RepID=A0A168PQB8_9BACL|nr:stage V sporulation protein AA [Paenibacillus antarcticus]OAB46972.1 stage V sporulation protein AA [Paenibacillus antarcticus]